MKILMAASEAVPFAQTGGLADVVYALSEAFSVSDNDVSIVMPFYKKVKADLETKASFITSFYINMDNHNVYCGIFKYFYNNITYYFIDNNDLFGRENIYGYDDDTYRFAFLDLAICEMISRLFLKFDIIHLHDWQVGMIPLLFLTRYNRVEVENQKFVLTIHNPAFQGMFAPELLESYFGISKMWYENGTARFEWGCSFLKTGIVLSDKITTVSKTHREEIARGEHAYGLNHVVKYRLNDFVGIVNGINYDINNPETDKALTVNYGVKDSLDGISKNKEEFCKLMGITNPELPLFSVVSRLSEQKGLNLLLDVVSLYSGKANFFVLGSGDSYYENKVVALTKALPNFYSLVGYSNDLAHKIYASSDFYLMPSIYEPCGIGQLIAQRYGALPIVRNTGGLSDTVIDKVDGFVFEHVDSWELERKINEALKVYEDKALLKKMVKAAMTKDHSWALSSKEYLDLYKSIKD